MSGAELLRPGARMIAPRLAARLAQLAAAVLFVVAAPLPPAGAAGSPPRESPPQVEVQVTLCAAPDEIVRALDLRKNGAALQVWLFDDDALSLFARGLRFRMRMSGEHAELTLKVANQDCAQLTAEQVPRGEGKCEYDLHGSTVAGAVSLATEVDAKRALLLREGRAPVGQSLSAAQVRYLRDVVRVWPLPEGVRALGPIEVLRYRTADKRYDVDVSRLPGGERYAEIARKVARADVEREHDALRALLARAGVAACADQSAQAVDKLRALLRRR
jgi:hypothetical protein